MIALLMAAAALAAAPLPPSPAGDPPSAARAVVDTDLQDIRGGASPGASALTPLTPLALDSAIGLQALSGQVTGNTISAQDVSSGGINFDGQALSGFSGIGNFILNTGMNSLLQGSVNVTVNMVGGH